MQKKSQKKMRQREVITGLIIIVVAFSFITSLLLDFNFVSPFTTLQDDLAYLSDHIQNQKISSWSWLATALIAFLAIPFYVAIFASRLKALHYLNGLFMLGASSGFLVMGLIGLELHQTMIQSFGEGLEQVDEQMKLILLDRFRDEQFYRRIGSSFVGLFAIGLSLSKFKLERFPLFSTILLILSGPALIFFNWYDPEHLVRTIAMAGIMIGVVVFCVRLINKGLNS
jgi:hypothetical protein